MSATPYHIPYNARQAITYTMPCAPGHTIYCAMPARSYYPSQPGHTIHHIMPTCHTINYDMSSRSYQITCHSCKAISYSMPCPSGHTLPCPPGHTIYHAMNARPCHIPHHAHQAIPYIMVRPPDHTIYNGRQALPYTMPYHISCHKRQAMPCPPGYTVYHAMPCIAMLCHIPCYVLPDHTLFHTMPPRPYHIPCHACQPIPYTMPCIIRPYHILCHACQAIPFLFAMPARTYHAMPIRPYRIQCTMPCPLGHTIYQAMSDRPYHIPCQAYISDGVTCLFVGATCS